MEVQIIATVWNAVR